MDENAQGSAPQIAEPTAAELSAEFDALGAEASTGAPAGPVPSAPPEPPPSAEEGYAEVLQPVLFLGFKVIAPAWNVSAEEAETLSGAYAPLLAKYFPEGPDKWGPEIGAALVTAAILGPRLALPRKIAEPEEPAANDPPEKATQPAKPAPGGKPGDDIQVTGTVPE